MNVVGNTIANCANDGIMSDGAKKCSIKSNFIYSAGGRGIESDGGQDTIVGNDVYRSGDENIVTTGGTRALISSNLVKYADQNDNGVPEFLIQGSDHLVMGNVCNEQSNDVFDEGNSGANILYVSNRGPGALTNMWNPSSMDAHSWGFANFPAFFDAEGTVTLSTGSTPAARVTGVSSTESMNFAPPRVQPDTGSTQPSADYSWESYMEWDDSAGAWDLVIEWRTDPGSNVSAVYEVTREPTSRAIKNT